MATAPSLALSTTCCCADFSADAMLAKTLPSICEHARLHCPTRCRMPGVAEGEPSAGAETPPGTVFQHAQTRRRWYNRGRLPLSGTPPLRWASSSLGKRCANACQRSPPRENERHPRTQHTHTNPTHQSRQLRCHAMHVQRRSTIKTRRGSHSSANMAWRNAGGNANRSARAWRNAGGTRAEARDCPPLPRLHR